MLQSSVNGSSGSPWREICLLLFLFRRITAAALHTGVVACAAGGRGRFPFFLFRWIAASARHPGVVACAAGGRGQGLAQPLAPYNPVPRVWAAIRDEHPRAQAIPPPPLCHATAGARTPAVPRRRGTSVRPASELPPLRGGDLLRALPRLRQQNGIVVPTSQALRRPLLWSRENGFPLVIRCNASKIQSRREENAPRRPEHEPRKDPSPQRAGARRRSPQRGSAAAGTHIAREAGRCAPICPLRRAAITGDMTCDSDARRHARQGGVRGA